MIRPLIPTTVRKLRFRNDIPSTPSSRAALTACALAAVVFLRPSHTQATAPSFCSMSSPSSSAVDDPRVVVQIPCLSDNYGYLLHDPSTGCTAAVDTPDAAAYRSELDRRGWSLTHVLNTHHHWDHTGGNLELKAEYSKGGETGGVTVIGPESERGRIPGIDVGVSHGDVVKVGSFEADVLDVGGHTSGHVAFHFKGSSGQQSGGQKDGEGGPLPSIVFTGDSLFALGCGKMFEGDQDQFWDSLLRLRELPDDTVVYW